MDCKDTSGWRSGSHSRGTNEVSDEESRILNFVFEGPLRGYILTPQIIGPLGVMHAKEKSAQNTLKGDRVGSFSRNERSE